VRRGPKFINLRVYARIGSRPEMAASAPDRAVGLIAASRQRPELREQDEENRLSIVRPLDALAAIADTVDIRCAVAIYRTSRRRRAIGRGRGVFPRAPLRPPTQFAVTHCSLPSAPRPGVSRSVPLSSICATRTRSTWWRMRAPPISSPVDGYSSALAAAHPSR
jgi:hypothetical protein